MTATPGPAEADGNRTRRRRGAPSTGFEDRGATRHLDASAAEATPARAAPAIRSTEQPSPLTYSQRRLHLTAWPILVLSGSPSTRAAAAAPARSRRVNWRRP